MEYSKFFDSKSFKGFLAGIGVFIVLLVTFRAGMSVGFHKADFSYRFSDNYHNNFGGPMGGMRGGLEGEGYMDAHGMIGQIIKIDIGAIVVKDRDGVEKVVSVKNDAQIAEFREKRNFSDFKLDDTVVVIGQPNSLGQIDAKLIRILPKQLPVPPMGSWPLPNATSTPSN